MPQKEVNDTDYLSKVFIELAPEKQECILKKAQALLLIQGDKKCPDTKKEKNLDKK
jgi:hypothetical protein